MVRWLAARLPSGEVSPASVDRLNIALMLGALGLAFALPFELFLFAYAVLGPLHYLTEISWLQKRDFFATGRRDWAWLALLVLLAFLSTPFVLGENYVRALGPYGQLFAFLAFAIAGVLAFVKDALARHVLAGAILVVFLTAANPLARGWFLFSLYTTTILHVFLFTAAFMLFGALKARSRTGYVSVALLFACAAVALLAPAGSGAAVSTYVRESYGIGFQGLNHELARLFGLGTARAADGSSVFTSTIDVFSSSGGVAIQRLIAFAYTYHYLNWFSKTSIIGWHQVARWKLAGALVLWIASVALYAHSYELGARWLFALSYAHVLLEFPLNQRSFVGIAGELRARLAPGRLRVEA